MDRKVHHIVKICRSSLALIMGTNTMELSDRCSWRTEIFAWLTNDAQTQPRRKSWRAPVGVPERTDILLAIAAEILSRSTDIHVRSVKITRLWIVNPIRDLSRSWSRVRGNDSRSLIRRITIKIATSDSSSHRTPRESDNCVKCKRDKEIVGNVNPERIASIAGRSRRKTA